MNFKLSTVKVSSLALTLMAGMCTALIAPSAYAGEPVTVDRKVTVKFKAAELLAENGTEKVYGKLVKKANRVCKNDKASLYYLGQSVDECAAELIEQFIDSANVSSLRQHHARVTSNVLSG